ncbi:hypothetical protein M8J77_012701 [Diaphorina citri]|nr:hypothetical protein M8J77_012701 [Diaphorina citri]
MIDVRLFRSNKTNELTLTSEKRSFLANERKLFELQCQISKLITMIIISSSLVVNIILAFFIVIVLINRYANWRNQNIVVTIAVVVSWYFSFLIIFILPLDITSTVYRQCTTQNNGTTNVTCVQPLNYVAGDTLPNLWRIIYWSTQFLTWFLLPLMQSYAKAGEFHFKLKLRSALYDNFIYYASFFVLALALLVYLMIKQLDIFNM